MTPIGPTSWAANTGRCCINVARNASTSRRACCSTAVKRCAASAVACQASTSSTEHIQRVLSCCSALLCVSCASVFQMGQFVRRTCVVGARHRTGTLEYRREAVGARVGQPLHGLFDARTRVQWEDALDNGIALTPEACRNPLRCFGKQQLRGTRRWVLKTASTAACDDEWSGSGRPRPK